MSFAPRIGIDGRWLSLHYPGIGRYVCNLLAALPGVAADERLVVSLAAENDNVHRQVARLDRYEPMLVRGGERRSLGAQLSVRRGVRRARLDLFHATYFPGALGIPGARVVSVHDLIPLQLPETIADRSRRLLYRLALRRAVTSASRILAPTEAVRGQLIELLRVPPERITVTPYAAALEFGPRSAVTARSLRARLGLPRRYLLYLGSNKPHKNLRRLLEAWKTASGTGAEACRLVLAGPADPRFPGPSELAASLGVRQVIVAGRMAGDDLPALLGGAEALIQPSLWEGFGLPVLEALTCATPVACSAIPPLLEVAGDSALTFDPLDTEAMGAAIRRLLRDPELRADLAHRGRERARRYSWGRTARLTLQAYREVLER